MRLLRYRQAASVVRLHPFDTSTPEGRSKERYRRIALNTFSSLATRGFGMLIGLVTVPLVLSYLGKETYGLWSAITALVGWVFLFDFGMVSGLVNSLSEAYGKQDREAARRYVSTAFFVLIGISCGLGVLAIVIVPVVPWDRVFATGTLIDRATLRWSVWAALAPILLGMPFSILSQICAGYQRVYVNNLFVAVSSLLTVGSLLVAIRLGAGLPILILLFGVVSPLVSILGLAYVTRLSMPWLKPKLSLCSRQALRRLLRTSVPLFLYQLGALLVNQSALIILAHRCDLATVAEFAIIMRVYVLFMSFISVATNSFVPSFREAFDRGDISWMQRGLRRMLLVRMGLAIAAAMILVETGNGLLRVWLHRTDMAFAGAVWLSLAGLLVAATWATAFGDFLTIMDRIWVQVGLVTLNGVVTVLATYWLSPAWGVLGAIVAISLVSVLVLSWLMPLLGRSLVRRTGEEVPPGPGQPWGATRATGA